MLMHSFQKCVILLSSVYIISADDDGSSWNYKSQSEWGGECNTGERQSPIRLSPIKSFTITGYNNSPNLKDYNTPLEGPLTIVNNGHTVNLAIPETTNGNRPSVISGDDIYEAQSLHFHWNSPKTKGGAEHVIKRRRYAAEMHIVHKNSRYETMDEATKQIDGLIVFGVMLNPADDPDRTFPGLIKILDTLPQLQNYSSEATIDDELDMDQIIGDLDTNHFYLYTGSLTTPNCSEAVTWYVFVEALPIPREKIEKFWKIRDMENKKLVNNYRDLQPSNGRVVFLNRP